MEGNMKISGIVKRINFANRLSGGGDFSINNAFNFIILLANADGANTYLLNIVMDDVSDMLLIKDGDSIILEYNVEKAFFLKTESVNIQILNLQHNMNVVIGRFDCKNIG